jgi:hypothetical protein
LNGVTITSGSAVSGGWLGTISSGGLINFQGISSEPVCTNGTL